MNVIVCAKLVPHADAPARLDPATNRLDRSGQLVLDDSDTYGVEMGLRLAAEFDGGSVCVLSMDAGSDLSAFRTALAMGADRVVVVADDALVGSDALGTAKVLAAAIRQLGADLVIAATESADGYSGVVPVQLAACLGLPSVSFARALSYDGASLLAERQTEEGFAEVRCPLPAVVTVTAGSVEVRYPSIRGIMAAKSKPIDMLSLADLGIDPSTVGTSGAGQETVDVAAMPDRPTGRVIVDDGAAEQEIISLLDQLNIL